MRWLEPPTELRAKVLAAAPVVAPRVTQFDRIWFSRAWRTAAAAIVVGTLAFEWWPYGSDLTRVTPTVQALAEANAVDDAGREIGLPPHFVQTLAHRLLGNGASRAAA